MPRLPRFLLVVILLATTMVVPTTRQANSSPGSLPLHQPDPVIKVIDFDDELAQPVGGSGHNTVATEYLNSHGARFTNPVRVDYATGGEGDPTFTRSGNNAVQPCYGQESGACTTPLTITFEQPQSRVTVWVGVFRNFETAADVTMTAYGDKEGGPFIRSDTKTLTPTPGGRLAIRTPLEVRSDNGDAIQRVEIGFSAPDDGSWLVFDDIELESSGVVDDPGAPGDPVCSEDPRAPVLGEVTVKPTRPAQVNRIQLKGPLTSTDPILGATLTSRGSGGEKAMALDPDHFNQGTGTRTFALTVEEILLPGENDLELTITNCFDSASAQLQKTYVPLPATPEYTVLGVEVTQSVQDLQNTVPLIAGKRTFVRIYLQVTDGTPTLTNVSGALPLCHAPQDDPNRCLTSAEAFAPLRSDEGNMVNDVASLTDRRMSMLKSLDFELTPDLWQAGRLWLDLGNLTLSPDFVCGNCATFAANEPLMSVDFREAPQLQIAPSNAVYTLDDTKHRPSALDWRRFESWLERAYPTSDASIEDGLGDFPGNPLPRSCQEMNQLMFDAWVKSVGGYSPDALEETPIRFFALVSHPRPNIDPPHPENPLDEDVEEKLREYSGCAAMAETPVFDPDGSEVSAVRFATGVAGSGRVYEWDEDGSFADFNGAHELGHVYGRLHVGKCGTAGDIDKTYKPDDGRISEDELMFGFDVGDGDPPPPRDIAQTPYHPDFTFDVMSYCVDRWISATTYLAILDNLPEETPTPEPEPEPEPAPDPDSGDTPMVTSLRVQEVATPGPPAADDAFPAATPTADEASGPTVLVVIGTIYLPENGSPTAEILPFSRLPGVAVTPRDTNGSFRIVLENVAGTPVATYPFAPARYTDTPPDGTPTAQMSEVVPWVENTDVIKIYGPDPGAGTSDPLATPAATPMPIATQVVSDAQPVVTVTAPNGGETLSSTTTVTWNGTDANLDDILTYTLLYSTDNGATWTAVASGLQDQRYTVEPERLAGSNDAIFRVIATDGVNTGQDDSDRTFEVPNNAPDVGIVAPADGSHFGSSRSIVLVGRARDVEQGELGDSALEWSSSIDGPIGPGRATSVTQLTPGLHTITLSATDDAGVTTESTIQVEIDDDDAPVETWDPAQDISSSPDGLFFYGGNERRGEVYTTDGTGAIQPLNTYFTFLHEWSAIVPGSFSGEDALTDLFLYSAETGLGEFYTSDGAGGLTLLSSSKDVPDPATGWEMVVPGNFGGDDAWTDLFFYDRETDTGAFYTSDGDGQLRLLDRTPPFDEPWTSIVPGNFGGNDRTDLLFYNAATGMSQFFTSDGQGCLVLLLEDPVWTPGWDQIVPGNFDGHGDWTDLFFSRAVDGKGGSSREYKVYATDGTGTIIALGQPGRIAPNWTTMVGGDFGGDDTMTDLLFYDAVNGQRLFLATDGAGGLVELSQPATGSAGWDLIVPGRYAGAG